jgi:xanthine/CO dehydrogenase XdhC/CoxF family maturation factor
MIRWLDALNEAARAGEPSVLITVVEARGSTPREAGSKMLVTRTGQFDTIGGGNLEHVCIAAAREVLAGTSGPALRAFPLGPALGQCCGGHATVLLEPMRPPEPHVAIFGAGHVGRVQALEHGGAGEGGLAEVVGERDQGRGLTLGDQRGDAAFDRACGVLQVSRQPGGGGGAVAALSPASETSTAGAQCARMFATHRRSASPHLRRYSSRTGRSASAKGPSLLHCCTGPAWVDTTTTTGSESSGDGCFAGSTASTQART